MELLAPRVDIGSGERERAAIADELLQRPPDEMTAEPERLVAGRPGYLLAYHDGRVDVWRVQEGRVRLWRPFPVERQGAARAYAGLPPETGAEARAGDSPQPAPS
jgi:hypothetical protein